MSAFERINRGFNQLLAPEKLSIGIAIPIENNANNPIPSMAEHLERVRLVEQLGFKAAWVRDVPFVDPGFGDAGQVFDPFVYLGQLATVTNEMTLATGSIALPLHYPANVAKAAATIDQLSGGRFVMGVASGDRPVEYPAMNIQHDRRGELFRQSYTYIRAAAEPFPVLETDDYGVLAGNVDLLPKPTGSKIPMLITANSRQSPEWIAANGDGWLQYPRPLPDLEHTITTWRDQSAALGLPDRPYLQSFLIDLDESVSQPTPIHLGFRLSTAHLIAYLKQLRDLGVNHVGLSLRFNRADVVETLKRLSAEVLPSFH